MMAQNENISSVIEKGLFLQNTTTDFLDKQRLQTTQMKYGPESIISLNKAITDFNLVFPGRSDCLPFYESGQPF